MGTGTLAGEMHVEQNASLEICETHEFSAGVRLSGNGQFRGNVTVPGTIAPGNSAGQLTFVDDLTLADGSLLKIELGGTQPGIDSDLLQIVGTAMLDGELQVSLLVEEAADSTLPGDYNEDGVVNAADFVVWRNTLGSDSLLAADGDRSSAIDAGDYGVWVANFSAMSGSGASEASQVPEPFSLPLIAIGLSAIYLVIQRKCIP